MLPIIISGSVILGMAVGAFIARRRSKNRRGVMKKKVEYESGWEYTRQRSATVTYIFEELDRVASQSKVKIIRIDDVPTLRAKWAAKRKIGEWVDTDQVEWDRPLEQPERKTQPDPMETVIKTDMKDLVKHIEREDVRSM
jgi:hypothetical protein